MAQKAIIEALEDAMKHLQKELKQELRDQGHYLTGALHNSIEYRVYNRGETVAVAEMMSLDYGLILEVGVPASRIPYSGNRRGGGGGGTDPSTMPRGKIGVRSW